MNARFQAHVDQFLQIAITAVAAVAWGCGGPGGDRTPRVVEDRRPVVYGNDDREDFYAFKDRDFAALAAETTAVLVSADDIDLSNPGNVRLGAETLEAYATACPDERFIGQPTPGWCSGTLIAPDLVLTAGHCVVDEDDCRDTRLVFGFHMITENSLETITAADVYACASLEVQAEGDMDYEIIRLDRVAAGRIPAPVSGNPAALPIGQDLLVAGYPDGLPLKIGDGGWVRDNRPDTRDYFVANLDTFEGNSGSGVFLASTGELVGILMAGDTDFSWDPVAGCNRVNRCPDNGCSGEYATYFFRAREDYCDTVGPAPFCTCGDGVCDGETETSTGCPLDSGARCGDGACTPGETLETCPEDCGTCPNEICDEAPVRCCADCGCPSSEICVGNQCVPDPAVGDTCASAVEIPATGVQIFDDDTTFAGADYRGSCELSAAPDKVYTFTLGEETAVDVTVEGFDTVLFLRTDCNRPDSEVDCNDDFDWSLGYGSRLTRRLEPGTYYLFVDGYDEGGGAYTLTAIFSEPLDNDTCADAVAVPAEGTQVYRASNVSMGNDYYSSCRGRGPDVVYRFALGIASDVSIEAMGYDTMLSVRTDCEDEETEIACNNNRTPPGAVGSRLELTDLLPGTYFVILDAELDDIGTYTLTFDFNETGSVDAGADTEVGDGAADTEVSDSGADTEETDFQDAGRDSETFGGSDTGSDSAGRVDSDAAPGDSDGDSDSVQSLDTEGPAWTARSSGAGCGCAAAGAEPRRGPWSGLAALLISML
jgi:hypothetical protein